jgi:hypothetical protein
LSAEKSAVLAITPVRISHNGAYATIYFYAGAGASRCKIELLPWPSLLARAVAPPKLTAGYGFFNRPVETRRGLPGDPNDMHSRYLEAAINGVVVGCLYLPNGNPAPGPKFDYKLRWFDRLLDGLRHGRLRGADSQPCQLFDRGIVTVTS